MFLKSISPKMHSISAAVLFILGCCATGFCDDEKDANGSKPEPIPVREKKDDYHIVLENRLPPNWTTYYNNDSTEYSLSVRSKIKSLPESESVLEEVVTDNYLTSGELMLALDPSSPQSARFSWFSRWLRDEVKGDMPRTKTGVENVAGCVALFIGAGYFKLSDYFMSYQKAIDNLPDEVAWKEELSQEVAEYWFIYQLERWTFYLYNDGNIEDFVTNPTKEGAGELAFSIGLMGAFDQKYDVIHQLPKSRFARLFPKRLKDIKEILDDPKIQEWAEENKDEIALAGTITVGVCFDFLKKSISSHDSIIK